ncbi:fatty acyl-AMP ligase [Oligoflexaceae bacterium]|nr:fatty acyl-AMP ligase [Oligoflexaceae bacterium]
MKNITDILTENAKLSPDKIVYRYLDGRKKIEKSLTYSELYRQSAQLAQELQKIPQANQSVLLFFNSDLEFIVGLFACMYAGHIPIPVYPTLTPKHVEKLQSIIESSGSRVILSAGEFISNISAFVQERGIRNMKIMNYDLLSAGSPLVNFKSSVSETAFIQYTSGSTGLPKGVVVSHENLMANFEMISEAMVATPEDVMVSWLPLYHDMGLVGATLHSVYAHMTSILLPQSSIVRPFRWLDTISRFKATITVAPNFAFEACVSRVSDEQKLSLDLSKLRVIFNGSEHIRKSTLLNFTKKFRSCGLAENSFLCCYGLAEATLLVAGGYCNSPESESGIKTVSCNKIKSDFVQSSATEYVSSGRSIGNQCLKILDPVTKDEKAPFEVGEISVVGPNVCGGYFQAPLQSMATFKKGAVNTLYTGDLGFVDEEGFLYVTGRLKELIIIRGKNYFPHDLENSIQKSIPSLDGTPTAIFSDEGGNTEKVILIQEARKMLDKAVMENKIKEIILEDFGITLSEIHFVTPNSLPRTTSGKLRRLEIKKRYLESSKTEVTARG